MTRLIFGSLLVAGVCLAISGRATAEDLEAVKGKVEAYRLQREGISAYVQAEQAYIERAHNEADSTKQLTLNELEAQRFQSAKSTLKQALRLETDLPDTHQFIANCYHYLDDLDAAIDHLSQALVIDPARDDILDHRVALLLEAGRFEEAQTDAQRLSELQSEFAASAMIQVLESQNLQHMSPTTAPQTQPSSESAKAHE
ncbi:MAG: tetratricopeptide repeat protein [Planctomycetota bacterium]